MRLIFDMDATAVDTHSEWLRLYNEEYNDTMTAEDITEWDMHKIVKPECGKNIDKYILQEGFFRNLKPLPGAIEGITNVYNKGHEVYFATALVSESRTGHYEKVQWIHEYLPFINLNNVITTHAKHAINGHLIFDDKPETLRSFPGISVCMAYKYNRGCGDYRCHENLTPRQKWEWFEALVDLFDQYNAFDTKTNTTSSANVILPKDVQIRYGNE